jgi:hypothetical protein
MSLQNAYRGGDVNGRAGWWLHFTYDEALIAAIKREIPAGFRRWDPDKERWWIGDAAEDTALQLIPSLAAYKHQGQLL